MTEQERQNGRVTPDARNAPVTPDVPVTPDARNAPGAPVTTDAPVAPVASDASRAPARLLALFLAVILGGAVYYVYLHVVQDYNHVAEWRESLGERFIVPEITKVKRTPEAISFGKILADRCTPCHGNDFKGKPALGPDLTDRIWLHDARSETELFRLITRGIPAERAKKSKSPMLPLGGVLQGEREVWQTVFFLSSINKSIKQDAK